MTIRRERRQDYESADQRAVLVSLLRDFRARKIDRRTFLTGFAALLTVTSLPSFASAIPVASAGAGAALSKEPWLTFAAVQDHLFPTSADAPGAREINATSYLKRVLSEAHTDPDDKEFIKDGAGWLNDIAKKKHANMFYDLGELAREQVLRQVEQSSAGERWISILLLYIFEALLSDPVYGGNPDGIGWTWLEHQSGFPAPPADKTYFKL
jgi:gluconate 2-dehydrogenase gamma chain